MLEIIEIPSNIKLLMCTKRIRLKNGTVFFDSIEPDVNYEAINDKEEIGSGENKQTTESIIKGEKGSMFALQIICSLHVLNLVDLQ